MTSRLLTTLWHQPRQLKFRKWLFTLHLWTGVLAGLLMTIIGLTGSLIVFRGEIEDALIPHLTRVAPQKERVPIQGIYDEVRARYEGDQIRTLNLTEGANRAISFWITSEQGRSFHVYANPYTGQILGEHTNDTDLTEWLYKLHTTLLAGRNGAIVNGIGAILLAFMCGSGLVIWWPGRKHVRRALTVKRSSSWKRINYDLHSVTGFAVCSVLGLVAITGVYFIWPEPFRFAAERLTGTPSRIEAPKAQVISPAVPVSLDVALAEANRALPEGVANWIGLPRKPGDIYSVRKHLPGDLRVEGANYVHIDPFTGKTLHVERNNRLPLGTQIMRLMFPIHVGSFGGLPTRILWVLLGLTPGALFFTGLLMWWNRVLVKRWRDGRTRSGVPLSSRPIEDRL
jgi:uncharacterized iron-regulated membrane protein